MKDSNAAADGQIGDERITVRRNVFLNWEGSSGANFALVGEDGMPYFEGQSILVENNLMIGNSNNDMRAAFGVKGGRDITFRANTVVGDLPSLAYALRVNREGANPVNENVVFRNNVWSDPTGTMGAEAGGGTNEFSDGLPSEASGLVLDNNLYWNGPAAIPPGDLLSPLTDDAHRVVADPQLNTNQSAIVLPRWNGASFASGNATIREEFERLVGLYGSISGGSPAAGQADPAFVPADDILGRPRGGSPDLGAYESNASGMGISPASGHSSGGTGVAITGFGFMAGAAVTLGGANATGVSVSSGAFATATTPSLPPGTLNDVTLTNPDATFSTLTKGWFSDFLDVPQPDPFHKYVERIFRNGITAGCGGGSYCRDASVTRAEMAVFLLKAFLGSGYTPPAGAGIFQDVPPGAFAADWIEDLANRGITAGCGNDNYCPNDPVTRAQMAVFLLKTLLGSAYTPPAGAGIFQDVPPGAFAIDWIEDLSSRGITAGCQAVPPRYCPDDPNTRGQMAVFLTKTFGLP